MPKYVVTTLANGMRIAGVRNPGPGGIVTTDRKSASPDLAAGWLREWGARLEAKPESASMPALEVDDDPPPFEPDPIPRRGRGRPRKEVSDGE